MRPPPIGRACSMPAMHPSAKRRSPPPTSKPRSMSTTPKRRRRPRRRAAWSGSAAEDLQRQGPARAAAPCRGKHRQDVHRLNPPHPRPWEGKQRAVAKWRGDRPLLRRLVLGLRPPLRPQHLRGQPRRVGPDVLARAGGDHRAGATAAGAPRRRPRAPLLSRQPPQRRSPRSRRP